MNLFFLVVMLFFSSFALADDAARAKLSDALIAGSPWSFSNKHVSETESWRRAEDGGLEYMSSNAPNLWIKRNFEQNDTIVRSSRAGGNTVTYSLNGNGAPVAIHSKNPSVFKSLNPAVTAGAK